MVQVLALGRALQLGLALALGRVPAVQLGLGQLGRVPLGPVVLLPGRVHLGLALQLRGPHVGRVGLGQPRPASLGLPQLGQLGSRARASSSAVRSAFSSAETSGGASWATRSYSAWVASSSARVMAYTIWSSVRISSADAAEACASASSGCPCGAGPMTWLGSVIPAASR